MCIWSRFNKIRLKQDIYIWKSKRAKDEFLSSELIFTDCLIFYQKQFNASILFVVILPQDTSLNIYTDYELIRRQVLQLIYWKKYNIFAQKVEFNSGNTDYWTNLLWFQIRISVQNDCTFIYIFKCYAISAWRTFP